MEYSFSLLPQKTEQRKLFEDDDDDMEETELFRSPIRGEHSTVQQKSLSFLHLSNQLNFFKGH